MAKNSVPPEDLYLIAAANNYVKVTYQKARLPGRAVRTGMVAGRERYPTQ